MGRDPVKHRANNVAYRERHKERLKESEADRRTKRTFDRRAWSMKRKFGITIDQWEQLFESQGRKCGACAATEPGGWNGWATDHDHETGEIRGILCLRCNVLLGWLGDTAPKVKSYAASLVVYLERKRNA